MKSEKDGENIVRGTDVLQKIYENPHHQMHYLIWPCCQCLKGRGKMKIQSRGISDGHFNRDERKYGVFYNVSPVLERENKTFGKNVQEGKSQGSFV